MEKYCKLKEAIRRQREAKVRQIPKKSEKNCLNKEKRKARKIVSKNFKYLGIQDVNDIQSMQRPSPKVYNFAV